MHENSLHALGLLRPLRIAMAMTVLIGAQTARADLTARHVFSIPPQALSSALIQFSKQADVQVVGRADTFTNLDTTGVSGQYTGREALQLLLGIHPLVFEEVTNRSVRIFPQRTALTDDEEKKGFWSRFRLAQANAPSRSDTQRPAEEQRIAEQRIEVEEIIVTAQKRLERLQDVPVPVTAVNAQTLVDANQLRLQDYYTRIPGLNLTTIGDGGTPTLAIRGVTTGGATNPTVGIIVDDVPYGPSTSTGGGWAAPDIDPSDLARIEVLRGPQGTLYGANSLGGLLKYVTVDPSTDAVSGSAQMGINSIHNDNDLGYNVRAAVNVPLGDTWAVRASGFTRREPGYIDDPRRGVDGVNRLEVEGGRMSALWRASDALSLKLSALLQRATAAGSSEAHVAAGLKDLQQNALPDTGGYERRVQAYSANVTAQLGRAELTSVSGYSINTIATALDATPALGTFTLTQFGVAGTPSLVDRRTAKFTQELRLTAALGERLEWLLGAFYTHERTPVQQRILAVDSLTGALAGSWYDAHVPVTFQEYAAFADVTFHLTERIDVQVGGRESRNRQTFASTIVGPYVPRFFGVPSPLVTPERESKDNAFTYLVTPQMRISPDLMVYARLASGYRPGGPNTFTAALSVPASYGPDQTLNYELGVKGNVLDRALTIDASLYYIEWKDIQISVTDPVSRAAYFTNGSRARSEGIELSAESRPLTGLTIAAWAAWNDAELTEDFPATRTAYGVAGDRLPYSSRFSGNLSVDQDFPLARGLVGFAGASVSYIGEREGIFRSSPQRQLFPSYAQTDLRFGAKYDAWTVNAFITNVADKRGVLRGGLDSFRPTYFTYIQPRTVGLSLSRTFQPQ